MVNILGFVVRTVSVATAQLCCYSGKVAMHRHMGMATSSKSSFVKTGDR